MAQVTEADVDTQVSSQNALATFTHYMVNKYIIFSLFVVFPCAHISLCHLHLSGQEIFSVISYKVNML